MTKHFSMNGILKTTIMAFLVFFTACSSGSTTILNQVPVGVKANSINIAQGVSDAVIPADDLKVFAKELNYKLFANGDFKRGNDLTLTYRFLHYDTGSRAARWVTGGIGGAGESSVSVEALYTNADGRQVGKVVSDGKLGMGFFGGSSDYAVERAADEIADYTKQTFK